MKSQAIIGNYQDANVDAIAVAVFKGEKSGETFLQEIDDLTGGLVAPLFKNEEFKGEAGEVAVLRFASAKKGKAGKVLLIGVGEKAEYNAPAVSVLAGTAVRTLLKQNTKSFVLVPRAEIEAGETASAAMQCVVTSQYEIDKYKTKDKKDKALESFVLYVAGADEKALKDGLAKGEIIGDSMNFTRDLCNEPANILYPTEMANRAQKMAKETGLKCEILDEAKMRKLGMGSLLSVSQGSEQPPKMIVLKYEPKKAPEKRRTSRFSRKRSLL